MPRGRKKPGKRRTAKPAKKRTRHRYTDQQRNTILQTAEREHLTAGQVKQRFGVTPVTYYSWRKKGGVAARRRGRPPGRPAGSRVGGGGDIDQVLRQEVRDRIRQMLPGIIQSELGSALGGAGRRRGRKAR